MKTLTALVAFMTIGPMTFAAPTAMNNEVRAANSFGLKNLQYVLNQNSSANVVYSPLSAHLLLGMLLNGADGKTADEISRTIEVPLNQLAKTNQMVLDLIKDLNARPTGELKINLANGMWIDRNLTVKAAYSTAMTNFYRADVAPLQSAAQINNWAIIKTNGLVKKIVDDVSGLAMILANATYFKADWREHFHSAHPGDFFPEGSSGPIRAQLMDVATYTKYINNGAYEAVEIPYGPNGLASMIAVLPGKGTAMSVFRPQITAAWFDSVSQQLDQVGGEQVEIVIPKTSGQTMFNMNASLEAMGMPSAFTDTADLRGISDQRLKVSYVKQDAAILIDEAGTEAAAVTSAGMTHMAMLRPPTLSFIANRPFYYFIRDNSTGVLLFAGQIVAP